jgi:hypothetical protein
MAALDEAVGKRELYRNVAATLPENEQEPASGRGSE